MKRIIYSCIFFLSLFLAKNLEAQVWTPTLIVDPANPNSCLYSSIVTGTVTNQICCPNAAANGYTWTFIGPNAPTPVTSYSVVPNTPVPDETITFSLNACGVYTITMFALNNGNLIGGPNGSRSFIYTVNCIPNPTMVMSPASGSICSGQSATLTLNGVAGAAWNPGGFNGNPYIVNPSATTCYTAIGFSAAGCTAQAVGCLTVEAVSVTVAPQSQTVCPTVTASMQVLGSPGYAYQWYEVPSGNLLGTAATQTGNPGTYSVTASFNGCQSAATASIVSGGSLSVIGVASSVSVCPTEPVVLTAYASATSYTWIGQGFGPPSFSTTTFNNSVTAVGVGVYTVIARNGACFGTTTIVVSPLNYSASISSSPPSVCPGESFTLTASNSPGADYYWVYLDPTSGLITPVAGAFPGTYSIVQTQNLPTTYGFSVITNYNCTDSANITVNITPNLTLATTASAYTVCAGTQVTLSANGMGAASYTWGTSAGALGTGSVITDTPFSTTVYTVIASNASGLCTSSPYSVTITMATGGAITATLTSSAATVCPQESTTLTAVASVSNATYAWTPSVSILGSPNNPTIVSMPDVSTIFTVNIGNGGGCSGTYTIALAVTQIPTVTAFANFTTVCKGFTSTLTAQGAASYTWMGSTFALPVVQQTIAVGPGTDPLNPATYTVIGAPAFGNCYSAPFFISVGLAPDLNITITSSQSQPTTCIITNGNIQAPYKLSKPIALSASGGTEYSWIPTTQPYITYTVGPNTTVRPPTTTCYTVIGTTQYCSGTNSICVTVIPQFTFNVTPLSPVMCIGDSMKLTVANIGNFTVGPISDFTYNWYEAANAPPPSLNDYGAPSITAYPLNTTTYTVDALDARGCASLPRLTTVTVLPMPITAVSVPTINNIPTYTLCYVGDIPGAPDNTLDLTATNQNTGLPFGVVPTYTWDSPYFHESFVTSRFFSTTKIVAPKRVPAVVVYTVQTGYNGVPGCKVIDTITVRVIDCRPIVQNSVAFATDIERDTLCAMECITYYALTDTVAGGPQTYSWTFEGGSPPTSTLATPVVCYNLGGSRDVTLEVKNPYPKYTLVPGSTATKAFRDYITVYDIPNVTIVAPGQLASDTSIRYGQSIALTGTNAIRYSWSPNYNISTLNGPNVTVSPHQTTQYILTGYNTNRCFSSDTINVIVIQDCGDMFIPNAFSPNGDGVNDELKVYGLCLKTLTFMVFNRWGEKVFETSNVNVGWDGTYNGDKLNTGVYVYRLEGKTLEGKGYSSKGNITLVR